MSGFPDAYLLLVAAETLETYDPVGECEQSIIIASAYVNTGVDLCPALADYYIAGEHSLTVGTLNAQTLGFAVSSVSGTSNTFFMCHL